ncbi:MAG TPA: hypothetical protein VGB79_01315 [Allosphingosinicella sp.]
MLNPGPAAGQAEPTPTTAPPPRAMASFDLPRMPGEGDRLILTRLPAGDRLAIRRPPGPPRLPALPLGTNLLAEAAAAIPFGVEERCRVEAREGGIDLICTAGTSSAGLLLRFDARYPRGAAASGAIGARGGPGFRAQFGRLGDDADDARALAGGEQALPLPGDGSGLAAQLVILAPPGGGTLRIDRVALAAAAAPRTVPAPAGAWAWEPALWQRRGAALLRDAAGRGLSRLSVTLAVQDGRIAHRRALAAFIREAGRQGIAIEAVEGDPDMIFPRGLASAAARARAIAAYQRSAAPDARLAGIQYDIEPYTLAGWGREPAGYHGWSHAVRTLARSAGAPVHLVLPFWIAEEEEGPAFLREIAAAVSGITIMAYRTDAPRIFAAAEPLLSWGAAAGKPVRVALETGPVAEETEESFAQAPSGRLAVVAGEDGTVRATLLATVAAIPGAKMYAPAGRTTARPERISFLGNDERMMETARALATPLGAWPAFAGFSFHGLRWGALEGRIAP